MQLAITGNRSQQWVDCNLVEQREQRVLHVLLEHRRATHESLGARQQHGQRAHLACAHTVNRIQIETGCPEVAAQLQVARVLPIMQN